jgi:sorbitol-specific phosphotransferase system component IIC
VSENTPLARRYRTACKEGAIEFLYLCCVMGLALFVYSTLFGQPYLNIRTIESARNQISTTFSWMISICIVVFLFWAFDLFFRGVFGDHRFIKRNFLEKKMTTSVCAICAYSVTIDAQIAINLIHANGFDAFLIELDRITIFYILTEILIGFFSGIITRFAFGFISETLVPSTRP